MSEIVEVASVDHKVTIAIVNPYNGNPAYWEDGGYKYIIAKVVCTSSVDPPPWQTLINPDQEAEEQHWHFLDPITDELSAPGVSQAGRLWMLIKPWTIDEGQFKLSWPGVDFTVIVVYWYNTEIPTPSADKFKELLAPTRMIYLVDASGSMAAYVQAIALLQVDTLLDLSDTVLARWFGAVVLKDSEFQAFPDSWSVATTPTMAGVVEDVSDYLTPGSGNSPIGALVANAQDLLDGGGFTEPRNLGSGILVLVTDGRENGALEPNFRLGGDIVEENPIAVWARRYGYTLCVMHYDALPGEIWDPWMNVITSVDLET